jgi:NAD(P)-dependent dehydrogenase (short-subunit alcohol dehydrogenase family)
MLLENKSAVIFGAGGAIARAFAREGATVFLSGREAAPVERRSPTTSGPPTASPRRR